jgi:hypothetical protein
MPTAGCEFEGHGTIEPVTRGPVSGEEQRLRDLELLRRIRIQERP